MRFVLDHDVDDEVCTILIRARHQCWDAADAIADPDDDAISVYAEEKNAIVISHDRKFADRRKDNTFGQHVQLACNSPDAVEVLTLHLDELITQLRAGTGVYEVSWAGVERHPPQWR